MSTSVPSASSASSSPNRPQAQLPSAAAPAHPASPPDRVAASANPTAPLLTIGAMVAAQLIPGTVEAEGMLGIATTIGIGVRAAMANPAVAVTATLAGGEAVEYAKSLAHDALKSQPGAAALSNLAGSLDSSIRRGLGIQESGDR